MPNVPDKPGRADVAAFLARVNTMPAVRPVSGRPGKLLFAIDATASRQPTWDRAGSLTADMFTAASQAGAKAGGGLAISLAYFRSRAEFVATPFLTDAEDLTRRMAGVSCLAGMTQIHRVLRHAIAEHRKDRIAALVFIGDAVEEDIDALAGAAGEMGVLGLPGFFFHEGGDPVAGQAFRSLARLSGGAYAPFDLNAAGMLQSLLEAVAVYAAGGRSALLALAGRSSAAASLTKQLPAPKAR
jgi:hypothetical protein